MKPSAMLRSLMPAAVMALLPLQGSAQATFSITGNIPNMPDSSEVVLVSEDGYEPKKLVSSEIKDGSFVLTGNYRKPEMCKMKFYVPGKKQKMNVCNIRVMLDNKPVTFAADTATILGNDYSMLAEAHVKFEGSEVQRQYMEYLDATRALERTADSASYAQARAWFDNNGNEEAIAGHKLRAAEAKKAYEECTERFIAAHPDYYPTAALLAKRIYSEFTYTAEQYDSYLELLKNNPDTAHVNFIRRNIAIAKKYAVGAQYTDFSGKQPSDTTVKLSELMQQDKYTLVDFWASWCGPCRAAIPKVKAMYEQYGSRLQVVSASVDEKEEAWRKAEKAENMPWPQMLLSKEELNGVVAQAYMINTIPRLVLISPEGRIIIATHDPALVKDAFLKADKQ